MDTRYRFVAMLDIMGASKLTKEEPDELGRILLESGVYMVKIGDHPARKVVVIR